MKTKPRLRLLLSLATFLLFTATLPVHAQGVKTEAAFRKQLQSLVGTNIDTLIAKWGAAENVDASDPSGAKRYRFQREPQEIEIADEKLTVWCEITLRATADGQIKSFSYLGSTCKAPDADPHAYGGPVAQIRGVGKLENAKTMLWFNFSEIYGAPKLPSQCQGETFRPGDAVPARCIGEQIPATTMKIKLQLYRNSVDARPGVRERMLAEGVTDFKPEADGIYEIAGEVTPDYASVWVQNLKSGQPATAKITRQSN